MSRCNWSPRLKPATSFFQVALERGNNRPHQDKEASNELQSAIGTAHGDKLGETGAARAELQRELRATVNGDLSLEYGAILLRRANDRFPFRAILQGVELAGAPDGHTPICNRPRHNSEPAHQGG